MARKRTQPAGLTKAGKPRQRAPGAGKPKVELDEATIVSLGGIGCTNEEIALILGCSSDTLVRNYAECLQKSRATMKMSLRRKQFELAISGNLGALIWLGKNLLGQTDRMEHTRKDIPAAADAQKRKAIQKVLDEARKELETTEDGNDYA